MNPIQFSLKRYWMFGGAVTTHGSPHEYDAHVPLMLWRPSWVRPGRVDARVEMVDLAPTLASFIGVPPPPTSEGKPQPLPTP